MVRRTGTPEIKPRPRVLKAVIYRIIDGNAVLLVGVHEKEIVLTTDYLPGGITPGTSLKIIDGYLYDNDNFLGFSRIEVDT